MFLFCSFCVQINDRAGLLKNIKEILPKVQIS